MKTYISIVSHGHQHMLMRNSLLASPGDFQIFVRENIPERCRELPEKVSYTLNLRKAGFGSNHNKTFEAAQPDPDDWFVICNPDIIATPEQVHQLLTQAEAEGVELAAPMLWNNKTDRFDHNVRPKVRLLFLMLSFVGISGPSRYSAEQLKNLESPDWASGAFLAIKAGLFRRLGGFDDRFFMYMEDVDLCCRAETLGARVRYFGNVRMIHNAARDNRKLFSRSFYNHLRSVMRYFSFDCKQYDDDPRTHHFRIRLPEDLDSEALMPSIDLTLSVIGSVVFITPHRFGDHRGFFAEAYSHRVFAELGIDRDFVQDNHSLSASAGTLRGLHFQAPPCAQAKLVRCGRGAIFDVAVDICRGGPKYGHWVGELLSEENGIQLFIPEGFAHGFVTLEPNTEIVYKCSDYFAPETEGSLRWDDPDIGIEWPLIGAPVLSEKDAIAPFLPGFESPFTFER